MLPVRTQGHGGPLLVLLHWLGGSGRTWTEVAEVASECGYRVASIDLPGFGEAAAVPNHVQGENSDAHSVEAMATAVTTTITSLRTDRDLMGRPWLMGGHSMGGKVAAVVARRAADGEAGLEGLRGLLLVSPSPPSPEPMPGGKREELLASLGQRTGDDSEDRKRAAKFLLSNTGKLALPPEIAARSEDDLLRMSRAAFRHWLESGSKEDWSERVGVLPFPALILAGSEDAALGPQAQREHTLPRFHEAKLVTLRGCGHLGPLERPAEVVLRFVEFAERLGVRGEPMPSALSPRFSELMEGGHTSSQTRTVMEGRLQSAESEGEPQSMSREELLQLRALVSCVVPGAPFDLAAQLDRQLAEGSGDGWRHAGLPADAEAWRQGLHSLESGAERLHGVPFVALSRNLQESLLAQASEGKLGKGLLGTAGLGESAGSYTGAQMKQWFEEVRGELTKLYVADPRTMERIGFTGFADEAGFTQIRLGQTEAFEA